MSTDATTPSNRTLDDIINNATSSAEMAELLKQYNLDIASGVASAPPPTPQPVAAPAEPTGTHQFYEVLYPHLNDRLEISAATQEELDRKKAAILAAYQK